METGEWIAIVSICLMIGSMAFVHFSRKLERDRGAIIADLRGHNLAEWYRQFLSTGLDTLRSITGKCFSLPSIGFCYSIALLYSITAALAGWGGGGTGSLGSTSVFERPDWTPDAISNQILAFAYGFLLLAIGVISYICFDSILSPTKNKKCENSVEKSTQYQLFIIKYKVYMIKFRTIMNKFRLHILNFRLYLYKIGVNYTTSIIISNSTPVIIIASLIGAVAIIGNMGGNFVIISAILIALAIFSFVIQTLKDFILYIKPQYEIDEILEVELLVLSAASFIALSIAGTLSVSAVFIVVYDLNETALWILIFWTILPLINAISDYVSLGFSHWFGRKIVDDPEHSIIRASLYGLADLGLALAFMLIAAATIPMALGFAQLATDVNLGVHAFVRDAAADPWGTGLWFGIMILTTLVWTGLHLLITVGALLFRFYDGLPLDGFVAAKLETGADSLLIKLYLSLKWLFVFLAWCVAVYVFFRLLNGAVHLLTTVFGSDAGLIGVLEIVALWGADLVLGPPAP